MRRMRHDLRRSGDYSCWIATSESCATTSHLAALVTKDQRDRQDVAEFMAA